HVVLNCSGDNSRPRWRLGLPGCKYDGEGNGVELKSSDEELARGTISESRVGEPGNPISVILFHGRRGRQREGAVFSGLLCSSIQNVAQRQRKDDGNAKASMQTAGYNGYTPRAAFQSEPAHGRSAEVPYWLFTIGQAEHYATVLNPGMWPVEMPLLSFTCLYTVQEIYDLYFSLRANYERHRVLLFSIEKSGLQLQIDIFRTLSQSFKPPLQRMAMLDCNFNFAGAVNSIHSEREWCLGALQTVIARKRRKQKTVEDA
ncbi:hypothetical protein ALC60_09643, partial [Trachymyrmex zeteki]